MAVTFPPSPNVGDMVTDPTTGSIWLWDSTKWTSLPASIGGEGTPGDYLGFQGSAVNWVNSGDVNSLGIMTLPPGDWDVTAMVSAVYGGANLNMWQPTYWLNGIGYPAVRMPNIASGGQIPGVNTFTIPLQTMRVNSPNDATIVEVRLGMSWSGTPTSAVNAQCFIGARRWGRGASSGGIRYLRYQGPLTNFNTGQNQVLAQMTLPPGDWDVNGAVIAGLSSANLVMFTVSAAVNGAGVLTGGPMMQALIAQNVLVYCLPLGTIRVNSRDAPADVQVWLQLAFTGTPQGQPNARIYLEARKWRE